MQHQGHFVNGARIRDADDAVHRNVAEKRNLRAFVFRNFTVGTAQEQIRVHAFFTQLLHGVLGGLRLQFTRGGHVGAEREVNKAGIAAAHAEAHLADRFHEGERFNVAHRTADFHHGHVAFAAAGISCTAKDEFLNFVRNVRDHLHGLAEVFAAAFLFENALIDLAGREVVEAVHLRRDEALVVTQVKVGFGPVFRHEHFAVLEGTHRTRIHVDVGIELDHRHLEPAGFKKGRQRSGGDALTQTGDNAAGYEYVLSHV